MEPGGEMPLERFEDSIAIEQCNHPIETPQAFCPAVEKPSSH
jgi:hypothetical protein